MISPNPKLNEYCSRYYRFRDLFHCGETWHKAKCDNLPMQTQSWEAYQKLAKDILNKFTETLSLKIATQFLQAAIKQINATH